MDILRVVTRIYLAPEQLEMAIAFYERLSGQTCRVRFVYAEEDLELASVGSFLLIAGREAILTSFKAISMTIVVRSIMACQDLLVSEGATMIDGPKQVPTGWNMHARHPDGTLVEYVQLIAEKVAAVNLVRQQEI
jgi:predicted enzyme related to lactoylglutathione lyase